MVRVLDRPILTGKVDGDPLTVSYALPSDRRRLGSSVISMPSSKSATSRGTQGIGTLLECPSQRGVSRRSKAKFVQTLDDVRSSTAHVAGEIAQPGYSYWHLVIHPSDGQ